METARWLKTEGSFLGCALNSGRAPLAASSGSQTTNGRAPTTSRPLSGRVSLALIGRKLLWERKFGKFHTSRSRAGWDINTCNKKSLWDRSASGWGAAAARIALTDTYLRIFICPFLIQRKKGLFASLSASIYSFPKPVDPNCGIFLIRRCLQIWWKKTHPLRSLQPRQAWTQLPTNPRQPRSTERLVHFIRNALSFFFSWCASIQKCSDPNHDVYYFVLFSPQSQSWKREEEPGSTRAWVNWKHSS